MVKDGKILSSKNGKIVIETSCSLDEGLLGYYLFYQEKGINTICISWLLN